MWVRIPLLQQIKEKPIDISPLVMGCKNKELGKIISSYLAANRRRNLKKQAVEYLGGKCEKCGYHKCMAALHFHHKNPNEKDFSISNKGKVKQFHLIKKELNKCILLCANCHAEEHYKIQTIKNNKLKDNINSLKLKESRQSIKSITIECYNCKCIIHTYISEVKRSKRSFCSRSCKNKFYSSYKWPSEDELVELFSNYNIKQVCEILKLSTSTVYKKKQELSGKIKKIPQKNKINWPDNLSKLVWEKSLIKLGKDLGVSDNAIRKRCKKLNIKLPTRGYWAKRIN